MKNTNPLYDETKFKKMTFEKFKSIIKWVLYFRSRWDDEWWNIQYSIFKDHCQNLYRKEYVESKEPDELLIEWAKEFYQDADPDTHDYWLRSEAYSPLHRVMYRPLGKRQKEVCRMLLNGHHITIFKDYDTHQEEQNIVDEDKSNFYEISGKMIGSLVKRGLLDWKSVYSTVQPNTETLQFNLKESVIPWVRQACITPTHKLGEV